MLNHLNDYLIRSIVSRTEFFDAMTLQQCTPRLRSAIGPIGASHWPPIPISELTITCIRDKANGEIHQLANAYRRLKFLVEIEHHEEVFPDCCKDECWNQSNAAANWFKNKFSQIVKNRTAFPGSLLDFYTSDIPNDCRKTFSYSKLDDATREVNEFMQFILSRSHIETLKITKCNGDLIWNMIKEMVVESCSKIDNLLRNSV
ncbi:hypothetical protein WR25_02794 [Diploscapter pachys]|uniref:Uncharacterized protein n=1 Tax=Diploscapter pachys TaxID=2018661 RepID=A0A2A2LXW8_9BILA|nr:hypothetical protein WR25_02794 [Diploscapter pachys]